MSYPPPNPPPGADADAAGRYPPRPGAAPGYGQPPGYGQQPSTAPGYGHGYRPGTPAHGFGLAPRNGLGLAAMILGIVAIVGSITVIIGLVCGVLALIFGIVGRKRVGRGEATNRGQATAGLVCGIIGLALVVALGATVAVVGITRYQDCKAQYGTQSRAYDHCLNGDPGY